jgi:AbrB family looped-hinge helix DNA binding protein
MNESAMLSTTLSSKGQVVIPKELRDAQRWQAGMSLTVEAVPNGLLIRAAKPRPFPPTTVDDVMGIARYHGPRLSDDEIEKRLHDAAVKRFGRPNGTRK